MHIYKYTLSCYLYILMYNNDEPNHDKTNTVPKALSEDSPVLPFIVSDLGHEGIKLFCAQLKWT